MHPIQREIEKLHELTNKEFYSVTLFFVSIILILAVTYVGFVCESKEEDVKVYEKK